MAREKQPGADAAARLNEQTHRDLLGSVGPEIEPHRPRVKDATQNAAEAEGRRAFERDEVIRAEARKALRPPQEQFQDAMAALQTPDPERTTEDKKTARLDNQQAQQRKELEKFQDRDIRELKDPGRLEFLLEIHADERLSLDRQQSAEREATAFQREAVTAAHNQDQVAYAAAVEAAQAALAEQQKSQEWCQSLREEAANCRENTDKNVEITDRQQRHVQIMEGRPLDSESGERKASRERNTTERQGEGLSR